MCVCACVCVRACVRSCVRVRVRACVRVCVQRKSLSATEGLSMAAMTDLQNIENHESR